MWEYWIGSVTNEDASIEENTIHLIKALRNAVAGQKVIKTTIFYGCEDDKTDHRFLPVFDRMIKSNRIYLPG